MGEWFARSVGICWVETLRMLAVSVGFGGLEGLDGSLVECAPGGIAVQGIKTPGSESLTVTPGRTWEVALALQTVEQRLWLVVGEEVLPCSPS